MTSPPEQSYDISCIVYNVLFEVHKIKTLTADEKTLSNHEKNKKKQEYKTNKEKDTEISVCSKNNQTCIDNQFENITNIININNGKQPMDFIGIIEPSVDFYGNIPNDHYLKTKYYNVDYTCNSINIMLFFNKDKYVFKCAYMQDLDNSNKRPFLSCIFEITDATAPDVFKNKHICVIVAHFPHESIEGKIKDMTDFYEINNSTDSKKKLLRYNVEFNNNTYTLPSNITKIDNSILDNINHCIMLVDTNDRKIDSSKINKVIYSFKLNERDIPFSVSKLPTEKSCCKLSDNLNGPLSSNSYDLVMHNEFIEIDSIETVNGKEPASDHYPVFAKLKLYEMKKKNFEPITIVKTPDPSSATDINKLRADLKNSLGNINIDKALAKKEAHHTDNFINTLKTYIDTIQIPNDLSNVHNLIDKCNDKSKLNIFITKINSLSYTDKIIYKLYILNAINLNIDFLIELFDKKKIKENIDKFYKNDMVKILNGEIIEHKLPDFDGINNFIKATLKNIDYLDRQISKYIKEREIFKNKFKNDDSTQKCNAHYGKLIENKENDDIIKCIGENATLKSTYDKILALTKKIDTNTTDKDTDKTNLIHCYNLLADYDIMKNYFYIYMNHYEYYKKYDKLNIKYSLDDLPNRKGLFNNGNKCYFNSTIQLLYSIKEYREEILKENDNYQYIEKIIENNIDKDVEATTEIMKIQIIKFFFKEFNNKIKNDAVDYNTNTYVKQIIEFRDNNAKKTINIPEINDEKKKEYVIFKFNGSSGSQEDASEALTHLFYDKFTNEYLEYNMFQFIFYGYLSFNNNKSFNIECELKQNHSCNMLIANLNLEKIFDDDNLPLQNFFQIGDSYKQIIYNIKKKYLLLSLNRFSSNGKIQKKEHTKIQFSRLIYTCNKYYRILGCAVHHGSISGGHYKYVEFNKYGNINAICDDSTIITTLTDEEEKKYINAIETNGYMFLYELYLPTDEEKKTTIYTKTKEEVNNVLQKKPQLIDGNLRYDDDPKKRTIALASSQNPDSKIDTEVKLSVVNNVELPEGVKNRLNTLKVDTNVSFLSLKAKQDYLMTYNKSINAEIIKSRAETDDSLAKTQRIQFLSSIKREIDTNLQIIDSFPQEKKMELVVADIKNNILTKNIDDAYKTPIQNKTPSIILQEFEKKNKSATIKGKTYEPVRDILDLSDYQMFLILNDVIQVVKDNTNNSKHVIINDYKKYNDIYNKYNNIL